MNKRQPAVAGYFYPDQKDDLLSAVDGFLGTTGTPRDAILAVMPHAGYVYSGKTAGAVAAAVNIPDRVIVLGPKHRHGGARAAVSRARSWEFPFGSVPVDQEMAELLASKVSGFTMDDRAHADEHSLEVLLPFLWRRNPQLTVTPVALGMHHLDDLEHMGKQLADLVSQFRKPVLLVTSTDMSHQLPIETARRLDEMAIDQMRNLNAAGLYRTVTDNQISMCGVVPVTLGLFAAVYLGADTADLINYSTSAEASGDETSVVGYAGLVVYK